MEQKHATRTPYGKKRDRLPRIAWTRPDRPELAGIAENKGAEFAEWAAAHEKATMSTVYKDRKKFLRDTLDFHLNEGILDTKRLRAETGQDPPTFYYMAAVLEDMPRGDVLAPLPPCGVGEHRASWAGNRRKLRAEYMLHMFLYQLQTGNSQRVIAGKYGIGQAAAGRRLGEILRMLDTRGMLPTTGTMSDEIREAPEDSALEIIGGSLSIDCKHTEVEAPAGEKPDGEAHSGKARRTTRSSLILCDKDGMLVGMGDPQPGRPANMTSLREALPDLGRVTDSLADPGTPPGRRITANVDRGMAGIEHAWKGANVRILHRRPPGQDLALEQRRENYETSSARAAIETNFRRINSYRAIGDVYRGAISDLGMTLNVLTGIVNLQRIMGTIGPSGPAGRGAGRAARGGADPAAESPARPSDDARRPPGRRSQTHHVDSGASAARDPAHPAALAPFPARFGHLQRTNGPRARRFRPVSGTFNARTGRAPAVSDSASGSLTRESITHHYPGFQVTPIPTR